MVKLETKLKMSLKAKSRIKQNINKENYKEVNKKARKIKVCLKCGKEFLQLSPVQKYCGSITNKKGCSWEILKTRPKRKCKDVDYHKKYREKWDKKNKEKVSWWKNKRNRLKRGADGNHTLQEWEDLKKKNNYTCQMCKKQEPFKNQKSKYLTEDHIIPLSKGGTDYINNIQPLCHSCNCKKGSKIIHKII